MALIKCSECGHMVSDKAAKCPKCGNPMNENINNGGENSTKRVVFFGCLFCVVVILLGWWFYHGEIRHEDEVVQDTLSVDSLTTNENEAVDVSDNTYLPISAILEIEKSGRGSKAKEKLEECGYEKVASKDNIDYWVKNTGVIQKEVGHGGGYSAIEYTADDTSKGSLVQISCDENDRISSFGIDVYERSAFEQWKRQFLELGYSIEYDETPYEDIYQNRPDTKEEACKLQKEGWTIGGGRWGGCWVDVMIFDKGNKKDDVETDTINGYMICHPFDDVYTLWL